MSNRKRNVSLGITQSVLNTRVPNGKIANFAIKLVAMAMSLRDQETGSDYHLRTNSYRLVKKVKIGPADPEILGLQAIIKKIKEITQAKHTAAGQVC